MKTIIILLGWLILPAYVKADTITLENNTAVNGRVTYQNGIFLVEANFLDQVKVVSRRFKYKRKEVNQIEFNDNYFNTGKPGTIQTMVNSNVKKAETKSLSKDQIYFKNRERNEGILNKITEDEIAIELDTPKISVYSREKIKLIVIAHQPPVKKRR